MANRATLLTIVVVTSTLLLNCRLVPSDASLESSFKYHRVEFEKLYHWILEDKDKSVQIVFLDYTVPSLEQVSHNGFSETRLKQYRQAMKRANIEGVIYSGDTVAFQMGMFGLRGSVYKGILHVNSKPEYVESSLDDISGGGCKYIAKLLELPTWYLYVRDCLIPSTSTRIQHGPPRY